MIGHLLEKDDIKKISSPKHLGALFAKLGYNFQVDYLEVEQLDMPTSFGVAIDGGYKIYSDEENDLEVFLLELREAEFQTNPQLQQQIITISQSLSLSKKKN
ncbi:MAG: hypothetical protein AB4080_12750 [Trichodesmium sp.]